MTCELVALCVDACDPARLAAFWSGVLGWEVAGDEALGPQEVTLVPNDTGFAVRFVPTDVPKSQQNQMHFDLTSSSLAMQHETVARALELGAAHIDVGQRPEEPHVVLADPEGNEFCVIEPGNDFLAECGFVGALASDGSRAVGYFWSAALGWPLVWDHDEETAIGRRTAARRSPGADRPCRPSTASAGCTSTSRRPSAPISGPRSSGSSRWAPPPSTSARATCRGW